VDAQERRRYSRQLLIPQVGVPGQERLRASRVLCVGAGGLGAPTLTYLAAAGVGTIALADDDVVDESNLQRQLLFSTSDVGRLKVEAATERLRAINPLISIKPYALRLDAANARSIIREYDCIIDGSDSFDTRYLVNDACVLESKPNIFASIYRFEAQVTVFPASGRPCYRCLYPLPPPHGSVPSCAEGGVFGAIAGLAGAWQATETLKLLIGIGAPLQARLLMIDALGAVHRELAIEADPQCELCGNAPTIFDVKKEERESIVPEFVGGGVEEIAPGDFARTLETGVVLLDVREPHEAALGLMPGGLHIPLSQLDARLHELDMQHTYLVACRIGQRSVYAVRKLLELGARRVLHLHGGLLAVAALDEALYLF
jgi:molybdopterin/thiamine biosynthesis adenylyltransferase/rhodanese-related sulfurtransferase